jgi:hypothetical protein
MQCCVQVVHMHTMLCAIGAHSCNAVRSCAQQALGHAECGQGTPYRASCNLDAHTEVVITVA